jgi:hypothetical protein
MFRSECYSKFLQGVEDAQITNLREQKINPAYRAFLDVSFQIRCSQQDILFGRHQVPFPYHTFSLSASKRSPRC